jgi:hypothetical protein
MDLYTYMQDAMDVVGSLKPESTVEPQQTPSSPASSTQTINLKRALMWSHHLLAQSKRIDIVKWSSELDLWCISKPGCV